MLCIGVIISALVFIDAHAINEVEGYLDLLDIEYRHADRYRVAAWWLISVGSAVILFHIAMIIVHILYTASVIEKRLRTYGLIVSVRDILQSSI